VACVKLEASVVSFLSISVALLSLGVDFLRKGDVVPGLVCVVAGVAVMALAVILLEKGIISKLAGGRQK
jgi:hypothetical protein